MQYLNATIPFTGRLSSASMSHLFVLLESDEVLYSEQWGDMFVCLKYTNSVQKAQRESYGFYFMVGFRPVEHLS